MKKIMFFILAIFLPLVTYAQVKVTGSVKDASGAGLEGASVIQKGSNKGVVTDLNGNFSMEVSNEQAVLQFSYLGYFTLEKIVGTQRQFNVILEEKLKAVDEVVVIGYGTVKKSSLTGSVSQMKTEKLGDRPIARVENALQGAMPGVEVRTTTGEPGQDIQIRVRGAASVNASSDPLYVIDGAPSSTLMGLSPSDIASIEVLKDAASTAIYGSRGSNGIIIVTTKKGKLGKPTVSLNASRGYQSLEKKLDLLSGEDWINFRIKYNDANYLALAKTKGKTASISDNNATRMTTLGGSMTAPNYNVILDDNWFNYVDDATRSAHAYTQSDAGISLLDWQDNFFRTAPIQEYSLNISGGSDNTNYMFSGGYFDQEGIATGTGYTRITLRSNIETKINKWMTAGIMIAPTYSSSDGMDGANGKDKEVHHVLSGAPVSGAGVGYNTNVNGNTYYLWANSTSSPTYIMNTNLNHKNTMRLLATGFIRFNPLKGLNIEATASTNYTATDGETYNYTSATSSWGSGEGSNSTGGHTTAMKFDNSLFQTVANYNKTLGEHNIAVMAGFSAEQSNLGYETTQTFLKPFANDAISESFDGSLVSPNKDIVTELTPTNLISYFGRFQYDYAGRYYLSTSVRRDGGSVFGMNNKWGTFPAISGAWKVSEEPFFQSLNLDNVSMLKLRASYGMTGNNAIDQTAAYALLTATTYAGASGYNISSAANPDLGWETAQSTDLAVDLGLFKNRIQMSLDYYTKKTSDLLYQVPVLAATGLTTQWGNLGDINNHGVELELNTQNMTGAFKWTTNFNISYNKNMVTKLGTTNTPVYAGFNSSNPSNVLEVGYAMNTFYLYEATGVWKTQEEIDDYSAAHNNKTVTFLGKKIVPGDIRYNDANNDGIYTVDDKLHLGSPTPTFTYGMTNNFSYRNFDLSIVMTAQSGGKIYGLLGRAIDRPGMGAAGNAFGHWRNAWWSEEDQGDGKTPYILSTTTGTTLDSRWLYSSDYFRIKNVTLGYTIPNIKKYLNNARVYLSVENLALFDKYYGGYSPESANSGQSNAPGGSNALGIDYGGYPISRVFTMGVNITF